MNQTAVRTFAIILHALVNFFIIAFVTTYDITSGWLSFLLFILLSLVLLILFILHILTFLRFIKSTRT